MHKFGLLKICAPRSKWTKSCGQCLLMLGVTLFVSGCATTDYCQLASPIYPTSKDVNIISQQLTDQVLNNNVTYERVCPG